MMNEKIIAFDMDGTFVDLYGVTNWLQMLQNKETTPYEIAKPMYNMNDFNKALNRLKAKGFKIAVISWCAKVNDKAYDARVRKAKKAWLKAYNVPVDEIHIVKYGTPKAYTIKGNAILVDDEKPNRDRWYRGRTIDATKNILKELEKIA